MPGASINWAGEGFAPMLRAWRIRAGGLGSDVRVRLIDESIESRAVDIAGDGALVLDTDRGARRITVGEY